MFPWPVIMVVKFCVRCIFASCILGIGEGFSPRLNRPKSEADHPNLCSAVAENALLIVYSWPKDRLSLHFFVVFPHSQMPGW